MTRFVQSQRLCTIFGDTRRRQQRLQRRYFLPILLRQKQIDIFLRQIFRRFRHRQPPLVSFAVTLGFESDGLTVSMDEGAFRVSQCGRESEFSLGFVAQEFLQTVGDDDFHFFRDANVVVTIAWRADSTATASSSSSSTPSSATPPSPAWRRRRRLSKHVNVSILIIL